MLAYEWFVETRKHYTNAYYNDWRTAWNKEWTACSKAGLMHHVMNSTYESVQVLTDRFSMSKRTPSLRYPRGILDAQGTQPCYFTLSGQLSMTDA